VGQKPPTRPSYLFGSSIDIVTEEIVIVGFMVWDVDTETSFVRMESLNRDPAFWFMGIVIRAHGIVVNIWNRNTDIESSCTVHDFGAIRDTE
jgi:hypothetical protein